MKQIRENTFETNSSSAHALVMGYGNVDYDWEITPSADGSITIPAIDFGELEAQKHYNDPLTKASYIALVLREEVIDNDILPSEEQDLLDEMTEVIKEMTGATEVHYAEGGDIGNPLNYDHLKVFKDKESLKKFLFSTDSSFYIAYHG